MDMYCIMNDIREPDADTALLHVYGDLNDFLPADRRETWFMRACKGHETIKNVVEACGVPHPEIAELRVNGQPVGFDYLVRPGDRIEVLPAPLVATATLALRPPLAERRFVLDTHLGRLAAYLRMLGYDSLYRNDAEDAALARLAGDEQRILLTRDMGLLKRSAVIYGSFVREVIPSHQIVEVARRYNLSPAPTAFQRCMRCNGLTAPVDKAAIEHLLEPKTRLYFDSFRRCTTCGKIYWQGSHYARMLALLARVIQHIQGATI